MDIMTTLNRGGIMKRLMALMVMLFCMCGSAWGLSTERSGLIYYPTDGASLVAMNTAAESRGFPVTFKLTHTGSGVSTPYYTPSGVTFSDLIHLEFEWGAMLVPASGVTARLHSANHVIADPMQQIYDGDGVIRFTTGGVVHPGHWGAGKNSDDYGPLQSSIDAFMNTTTGLKGTYKFSSGTTYTTTRGLLFDFDTNNVEQVIIEGRGANITSDMESGVSEYIISFTSDATVRNIIIYPPALTGNYLESGGIRLDGGDGSEPDFLYNWSLIDAHIETVGGNGIYVVNNAFECKIVRPFIDGGASNDTGSGILLLNGVGNISSVDIYSPITREFQYGIQASIIGTLNIFGGTVLTADKEGIVLSSILGGTVVGTHLENNYESGTIETLGQAGMRINGGTVCVSGVYGTSNNGKQTHIVNVYPTVNDITLQGLIGTGDTITDVYINGGDTNSNLTLLDRETTVTQINRQSDISRPISFYRKTETTTTTGTDKTLLMEYTLPGNTLGYGGRIDINMFGNVIDVESGIKTIEFVVGSGNTTTLLNSDVDGAFSFDLTMLGFDNTNEVASYTFIHSSGAALDNSRILLTEDQTEDIIFRLYGTCSGASDSISLFATSIQGR